MQLVIKVKDVPRKKYLKLELHRFVIAQIFQIAAQHLLIYRINKGIIMSSTISQINRQQPGQQSVDQKQHEQLNLPTTNPGQLVFMSPSGSSSDTH